MKEVTAYRDEAGGLHETEEACVGADRKIRLRRRIGELLDQYGWNGMDKDSIRDLIMEHADDLVEVLK